jgi:hypothetical protein
MSAFASASVPVPNLRWVTTQTGNNLRLGARDISDCRFAGTLVKPTRAELGKSHPGGRLGSRPLR